MPRKIDLDPRLWDGDRVRWRRITCLSLTEAVVRALRSVTLNAELATMMDVIARETGFAYFALAHHENLPERWDDVFG